MYGALTIFFSYGYGDSWYEAYPFSLNSLFVKR